MVCVPKLRIHYATYEVNIRAVCSITHQWQLLWGNLVKKEGRLNKN